MDALIDTGVLIRLVLRHDPAYPEVRRAISLLRSRGDRLFATTQNAAEFWSVCTRPPASRGGYGVSIQETARKLKLVERLIEIKSESMIAYEIWKQLVVQHCVQGVGAHDARLVAAMRAFGITHLVTINKDDFKRFPGITVLEPREVN